MEQAIAMGAVLEQGCLELRQQLLGHFRGITAAAQPRYEFLLARDVALTLDDVIVHHSQIGRAEAHAQE